METLSYWDIMAIYRATFGHHGKPYQVGNTAHVEEEVRVENLGGRERSLITALFPMLSSALNLAALQDTLDDGAANAYVATAKNGLLLGSLYILSQIDGWGHLPVDLQTQFDLVADDFAARAPDLARLAKPAIA